MKQMLVSKFVEERIGDIFDQYKSKWFKDGVFVGIDGVIAVSYTHLKMVMTFGSV